jgi:asparagine synthetase B (glutamine-hydrolysing)
MHEEGRVPKLPTYCYTDRMIDWPDTEESEYRNAVVARLPHFHCEWIDQKCVWTWKMVEAWQQDTSAPINLSNIFTYQARMNLARESGCRVMLAGTGGDIITGGEDYGIVTALESLSWLEALGELRYFTRGTVRGTRRLLKKFARTHLPPTWFQWLQKRRGVIEELYTLDCERVAKAKEEKVLFQRIKSDSPLQRFIRTILFSPLYYHPFEQGAEVYALHGIEFRTPFYDRRLVELAFQQPIHLRIKGGKTRVLHKKALKQDLPPLLSRRDSKADFTRFTAYSISEADHVRASTLKPDALTRQQRWLDLATWENWSTEPKWPMQTVFVHRLAHLEQWLSLLGEEQFIIN